MATWGERRKTVLVSVAFTGALLAVLTVLLVTVAPRPTEPPAPAGEEPRVLWSVTVPVGAGTYNAVAHFKNTDGALGSPRAGYRFEFYDTRGELLGVRRGETSFAPGESFYIFEGAFSFDERPAWTALRWENIVWTEEDDPRDEYEFSVSAEGFQRLHITPRLDASLVNLGMEDIDRAEVFALAWDEYENVVGVSRTRVDDIGAGEDVPLFFTWPGPFIFEDHICEPPLSVAVVVAGSESGDLERVLTRFDAEVSSGFSWTFNSVSEEEVWDAVGEVVEHLDDAENALMIIFLSEEIARDTGADLLDRVGAREFVTVVYDGSGLPQEVRTFPEGTWEGYLRTRVRERCVQEPARIELPARVW